MIQGLAWVLNLWAFSEARRQGFSPDTPVFWGQKGNDGKERVIYYGGRALRKEERNWSVTEREVLAILQGVEEYKVYLTGQKFTVITDHYAAQFLKKIKNETGRLGRWSLRLQAFDFEVKYRPGKQNGNVDGLSRRTYDPEPETAETVGELPETFTITPDTDGVPSTNDETTPNSQERIFAIDTEISSVRHLQRKDAQLMQMINYLESQILPDDPKIARRLILEAQDHVLDEGVLYHFYYPRGKGHMTDSLVKQLVVPHALRNDILLTPLSHERLVASAHELGTSQDCLETSQDGLGCVLARPCMSRQVTETEREIPFFSHRLVAAVDFILSREIKFSPPPATKMQLNCIGPSRLVPAS